MRILSPADVSAGLPAPSAAAALLGTSGAAAMLILLVRAYKYLLFAKSSKMVVDVVLGCYVGYIRRAHRRILPSHVRRVQTVH